MPGSPYHERLRLNHGITHIIIYIDPKVRKEVHVMEILRSKSIEDLAEVCNKIQYNTISDPEEHC